MTRRCTRSAWTGMASSASPCCATKGRTRSRCSRTAATTRRCSRQGRQPPARSRAPPRCRPAPPCTPARPAARREPTGCSRAPCPRARTSGATARAARTPPRGAPAHSKASASAPVAPQAGFSAGSASVALWPMRSAMSSRAGPTARTRAAAWRRPRAQPPACTRAHPRRWSSVQSARASSRAPRSRCLSPRVQPAFHGWTCATWISAERTRRSRSSRLPRCPGRRQFMPASTGRCRRARGRSSRRARTCRLARRARLSLA
mmetsp:Transcript_19728/g.50959  ORF Transcript_19728/g.50959 Transcript_19728/m.50959 type:complete len:261 (-) Transcript_19728:416-1198(-)